MIFNFFFFWKLFQKLKEGDKPKKKKEKSNEDTIGTYFLKLLKKYI